MTFWFALLFVAVIATATRAGPLRRSLLDRYPADANGNPIVPASNLPALEREVEELRARIRTLERILAERHGGDHLFARSGSWRERF